MAQKKLFGVFFFFNLFFFFRGIFTPVGGREGEKRQKKDELRQKKDELRQKKDELRQKKDELRQKFDYVAIAIIIASFYHFQLWMMQVFLWLWVMKENFQ
jgi:hypothetical protein